MRKDICCSEPVSSASVEEDCTGGLAIEMFDDSDKVGAVVLLYSCMMNSVEGLLEVYEDMEEVLLAVELFLTKDS